MWIIPTVVLYGQTVSDHYVNVIRCVKKIVWAGKLMIHVIHQYAGSVSYMPCGKNEKLFCVCARVMIDKNMPLHQSSQALT